jgi:acetyltransferase-like isoleucine patch superfamily enzyme
MNLINKVVFYLRISFSRLSISFKGLVLKNDVLFNGRPHIMRNKDAIISIGSGTLINSSNKGYHINMHSKCKLYADRENAKIIIGNNCRIHGTCIHATIEIRIGNNCLVAANTQIIDSNGHPLSMYDPIKRLSERDEGKKIIIEDNVWIAANSIILGGAIIGCGSVITAGSVVRGSVPPNSVYGGNPAKLIKEFKS